MPMERKAWRTCPFSGGCNYFPWGWSEIQVQLCNSESVHQTLQTGLRHIFLWLKEQTHLQERTLGKMLPEFNWRVMKLGISSVCLHKCSLQEERPLISFFRDICFCSSCLFPYGIAVCFIRLRKTKLPRYSDTIQCY